jgi:hypothetical protein
MNQPRANNPIRNNRGERAPPQRQANNSGCSKILKNAKSCTRNISTVVVNTNFFFVLKIIIKALLSPGNILTLLMRFLTVVLVIFHYQIIEGIDY